MTRLYKTAQERYPARRSAFSAAHQASKCGQEFLKDGVKLFANSVLDSFANDQGTLRGQTWLLGGFMVLLASVKSSGPSF
jgi:hypothetical protein